MIVFGLDFKGLEKNAVLHKDNRLKQIATVNAEFIVEAHRDQKFLDVLKKSMLVFDGEIPFRLAKLLNPKKHIEKLPGSELVYDFCELAKRDSLRVFLLGGLEKSNSDAVSTLRDKYSIDIEGFSPEYAKLPFSIDHNNSILEKIKSFEPDILLVGFGAKKQELWTSQNYEDLNDIGVKWAIGVGGTFEMVAGVLKRAPKWIQKSGLEGFYRFLKEPKLFRFKRLIKSFGIFKYVLYKGAL